MAIWGVGAKFGGWDNKLDSFVKESFWCTGFKEQEKPEVYEMIKSITFAKMFTEAYLKKGKKTINKA